MAKGSFRGGGYGGMNQAQMMRQAQKMQQDLLKAKEELDNATYAASAGGGAVNAVVNGKHEIVSLAIEPDALVPEDADLVCDMVKAAINEALRKAADAESQNMARLTGGLNLGF